ncbi:hypothetical protein [Streptomyces sp. NPDC088725]|uniref:hypothetical protein n=1 Tax=Streptomyces sp. NPDC088725 TaxID=3365873 RepID=UPI00380E1F64
MNGAPHLTGEDRACFERVLDEALRHFEQASTRRCATHTNVLILTGPDSGSAQHTCAPGP